MRTSMLDFQYPEDLVATEPQRDYRALLTDLRSGQVMRSELVHEEVLNLLAPGDLLVINDTRVLKRRVYTDRFEILFINEEDPGVWNVLFPARDLAVGDIIALPGGLVARLVQKRLPQKISVNGDLSDAYFARFGEFALPPYIQKARGERHSRPQDNEWYQTAWAQNPGSCAAPTASLHFTNGDLKVLRERGVGVERVTLHVGLGTFLPVKTEDLDSHVMHKEFAYIPPRTLFALEDARSRGGRIWALGTTVTRTLESLGQNLLRKQEDGGYGGESDLFIRPGYEWRWVDGLLTNFHQPKSTLLALVAAFAGLEETMATYRMAIERGFRLFSYGDLSIWIK